jgi:arylsulfatase A-like enzyme
MINTDHAKGNQNSRTHARLPLLLFFPNQDPKGRVKSNVQLLDVAPTLLDYLRVDKPDWMEGESVLREEPDRLRRIVSVYAERRGGSPSERIYAAKVVICNRVYGIRFPSQHLNHSPVEGHTDPCSDLELPDHEEVRQFILEHLQSSGIDLPRDVQQAK